MENKITVDNAPESKKKGNILVIEDNPDWIEYLKMHLEKAGFIVTIASDLTIAKELATKDRFHFITIDMQLKSDSDRHNFEGWDILRIAKELNLENTTPCMVVTAYPEDYRELAHIKKLKSMFFMSKPAFDKRKFIETIENTITEKKHQI